MERDLDREAFSAWAGRFESKAFFIFLFLHFPKYRSWYLFWGRRWARRLALSTTYVVSCRVHIRVNTGSSSLPVPQC